MSEYSLQRLQNVSTSEEASRAFLLKLRWPTGFRCPLCRHRSGREVSGGQFWVCGAPGCRYRTCTRVGTFLEGSRKPIQLYLKALHAFLETEQGITAPQLVRNLKGGISVPTAWAWLQRFRLALRDDAALRRSVIPQRSMEQRNAAAWRGASPYRSAIAWLRSKPIPSKKWDPFVGWLLEVYAGRVSSKHLESYWLEYRFRATGPPPFRSARFFKCLGKGRLPGSDAAEVAS